MKYIRTKNEVYEFRELVGFETYLVSKRYNEYSESLYRIEQKDIIKTTDNIKELFDEIVAVPHNGEKPMLGRIEVPASGGIDYPMFLNQKTGWYHDLYSFVGVYGAIWVIDSNGTPTLKPAAKLNKKGKWELL